MIQASHCSSACFSSARDVAHSGQYCHSPSSSYAVPNRYSRPSSPQYGSPSKSKNTSPGRRLGQAGEAALGLGLEELVERTVEWPAADLNRRLRLQRSERRAREARNGRRLVEAGELADRVDPCGLELETLPAVQVGDERNVVVGSAAVVAHLPPVAELALADLVRIGGIRAPAPASSAKRSSNCARTRAA